MTIPITTSIPSNLNVETSDLLYLLNLIKTEIKSEINCHAIGTIQTFDPVTQTCSVLFNYQKVLKKRNATIAAPNQFSDVVIPYPMLIRVPIVVLGGGGAHLTFPIASGDTCLVFFIDRDIDLWLELGGTNNPPNTERLHDLSDGVALVGLSSVVKPLGNYNTQEITLTDQQGNRVPTTGDMKPSMQVANHSGWLLMNGQTIGPLGAGATNTGPQYQMLYTLLGGSWPGGPVIVPDIRGCTVAGYLSGDPNFGTLGVKIGESAHVLTIPEIPSHTHVFTSFSSEVAGSNAGSGDTQAPFVGTTQPTGGGLSHNNIQPTFIGNWFIKI